MLDRMSRADVAESFAYSLIALTLVPVADAVPGQPIPADHSHIPATATVSFDPDTDTFFASGNDENVNLADVGYVSDPADPNDIDDPMVANTMPGWPTSTMLSFSCSLSFAAVGTSPTLHVYGAVHAIGYVSPSTR